MLKNIQINDAYSTYFFDLKIDDTYLLLADDNVIITTGDFIQGSIQNKQIIDTTINNIQIYDV